MTIPVESFPKELKYTARDSRIGFDRAGIPDFEPACITHVFAHGLLRHGFADLKSGIPARASASKIKKHGIAACHPSFMLAY